MRTGFEKIVVIFEKLLESHSQTRQSKKGRGLYAKQSSFGSHRHSCIGNIFHHLLLDQKPAQTSQLQNSFERQEKISHQRDQTSS